MLEDIRNQLNHSRSINETEMTKLESRLVEKIAEASRNTEKYVSLNKSEAVADFLFFSFILTLILFLFEIHNSIKSKKSPEYFVILLKYICDLLLCSLL